MFDVGVKKPTEGLLTNAIVRTKLSRVLIDLYSLSWKDNHD